MIFSKSQYKILKTIYENPDIKISELLKKTTTSPQVGYKHVNELIKIGAISEKRAGRGKKSLMRFLRPSYSDTGREFFTLIEIQKKNEFFDKHSKLKGPFIHFEKELKEKIVMALIFGSFARGSETHESDIDVVVITRSKSGKKDKKIIERLVERCFVTLRNRASIRMFNSEDFINMLKNNNEFAIQIKLNHIAIVNARNWIDVLASV